MRGVKDTLDRIVSAKLGVPQALVTKITSEFLNTLREHIASKSDALLVGFGRFVVQKTKGTGARRLRQYVHGEYRGDQDVAGTVAYYVRFRPASAMKGRVREYADNVLTEETTMDKFGVDEHQDDQEELEKRASKGCPICGRPVEVHGKVLLCPVHGTEPFEE